MLSNKGLDEPVLTAFFPCRALYESTGRSWRPDATPSQRHLVPLSRIPTNADNLSTSAPIAATLVPGPLIWVPTTTYFGFAR